MAPERSCVVVGAGPGLGMAVARRFAASGLAVAAISRSAPDLSALGDGHLALAADAGRPADLTRAIAEAADALPPLAVLVYNAAMYPPDPPSGLEPGVLETSFAVNVSGALVAVQAALPVLGERGGTVLLTGGGAALRPTAPFAALGVTKAALRALAYALHEDLRPAGVQVTTVTINGLIGSSDAMAPDRIAERYGAIHERPEGRWQAEEAYP